MENKSIYEKLQQIRVDLQKKDLKKSGYNSYKDFNYYELGDFLPSINELLLANKIVSIFTLQKESAKLELLDYENGDHIEFNMPYEKPDIKGADSIQNLGGSVTYLKRYLFVTAFDLCENDEKDANRGKPKKETQTTLSTPKKETTAKGKGNVKQAVEFFKSVKSLKELESGIRLLSKKEWTPEEKELLEKTISEVKEAFNNADND